MIYICTAFIDTRHITL